MLLACPMQAFARRSHLPAGYCCRCHAGPSRCMPRASWQRRRRVLTASSAIGAEAKPGATAFLPPELSGIPASMRMAMAALPPTAEVLLRRPAPRLGLRWCRSQGSVEEVTADMLGLASQCYDCVADAGALAQNSGLFMDLAGCRWDVLGRTEEALNAVASLLRLLRPGGCLLVLLHGDPVDYLVGYLHALLPAAAVLELPLQSGSSAVRSDGGSPRTRCRRPDLTGRACT